MFERNTVVTAFYI